MYEGRVRREEMLAASGRKVPVSIPPTTVIEPTVTAEGLVLEVQLPAAVLRELEGYAQGDELRVRIVAVDASPDAGA